MQNKIIIFGDSFADPNERHDENPNVTTWYESLGSDYDITNHALSGTGPHYSFKEYYNFITDNEIKKKGSTRYELPEDYVTIFLLSGEDRIHFLNTLHHPHMNHIRWDFDNKKSSAGRRGESGGEQEAYYKFYRNEIDFMFLTMHDELKWSNFKNIGFLYMNSLLLNMKIIVFCTFGIKILSKRGSFLDMVKLNNPNFYLHPLELGHISKKEFIDFGDEGYDYVDNRRNHLSQENHTILYENMKKFIKNDYNPIPFAKNIDYSYNFGKKRDTKTGNFIYE